MRCVHPSIILEDTSLHYLHTSSTPALIRGGFEPALNLGGVKLSLNLGGVNPQTLEESGNPKPWRSARAILNLGGVGQFLTLEEVGNT